MIRSGMSETAEVVRGLRHITERIEQACSRRPPEFLYTTPRLVAVSKTKPREMIIAAYESGQRHFGENYIQELSEKGNDPEIIARCPDIKWHFIGRLQRNKLSKVLPVPGLYLLETIDSERLATSVNQGWQKRSKNELLKVMVQVNTSNEQEKGGCEPEDASALVKHVIETCTSLKFLGLMTIGQFGWDLSQGPNPDFQKLMQCKEMICKDLKLDEKSVEISMGMSDDFEHAIVNGSTNVRVGSSIFGARAKKAETSSTSETTLDPKMSDLKL